MALYKTINFYWNVCTCAYNLQALRLEEENDEKMTQILAIDERKRPYSSMRANESREPTEEEMEAYRLKRKRQEDPMAGFLK